MFSDADVVEMHRRMLVIRGFEERVSAMYRDGEIPGFVHLSIGQEASAVGACWPLRPTDVITSTHRGHGHCLAKGLDPGGVFAELRAGLRGVPPGVTAPPPGPADELAGEPRPRAHEAPAGLAFGLAARRGHPLELRDLAEDVAERVVPEPTLQERQERGHPLLDRG